MALAQNLIIEKNIDISYYQYYLSVELYLEKRYEEAIYHLENVVQNYGKVK